MENRGQAWVGKIVETNGDSEIKFDNQDVDMESDASTKDANDNAKRKRGAEVVGRKMDEEDNEAGFEVKRNKKGSNKKKEMDSHDSNLKKKPESNQSPKEKIQAREADNSEHLDHSKLTQENSSENQNNKGNEAIEIYYNIEGNLISNKDMEVEQISGMLKKTD